MYENHSGLLLNHGGLFRMKPQVPWTLSRPQLPLLTQHHLTWPLHTTSSTQELAQLNAFYFFSSNTVISLWGRDCEMVQICVNGPSLSALIKRKRSSESAHCWEVVRNYCGGEKKEMNVSEDSSSVALEEVLNGILSAKRHALLVLHHNQYALLMGNHINRFFKLYFYFFCRNTL